MPVARQNRVHCQASLDETLEDGNGSVNAVQIACPSDALHSGSAVRRAIPVRRYEPVGADRCRGESRRARMARSARPNWTTQAP